MRKGGRRVARNAAINAHVKRESTTSPVAQDSHRLEVVQEPAQFSGRTLSLYSWSYSDDCSIDQSLKLETVLPHAADCQLMSSPRLRQPNVGARLLAVSNA